MSCRFYTPVDQFSLMFETMDDLRSYYYVERLVKLIECETQYDSNLISIAISSSHVLPKSRRGILEYPH